MHNNNKKKKSSSLLAICQLSNRGVQVTLKNPKDKREKLLFFYMFEYTLCGFCCRTGSFLVLLFGNVDFSVSVLLLVIQPVPIADLEQHKR